MRTRWLWALAGVLAGVAGLATSLLTAGLLDLRGNPITDVAELVVRLTPGNVAEDAIQLVGHKDKPLLVTGVLVVVLLLFAVFGVLARRSPGAGVAGFVILGVVGLIAEQSQFGAPPTGVLPILVGVITWLAVLALLTAPLRPRPFDDTDQQRRFLLIASGVGLGSLVVGVLGLERRRSPPRGRRGAQVAQADRRHVATGAGRRRGRAQRHRGVADPDEPLLPDRHLVQPTGDRAAGLDPAHPRDGRPRDDADVRRPAGAATQRDVDDAQLRVEHRRRQPDQQRLVERRPAQGPAGRGRRPVRCRRGQADLRRRLDVRDAALGAHRRSRRDARDRDERPAAPDRARLPGADPGARALRLRVGVQVGPRPRGDHLRLVHGVLDRSRVVGAAARSSSPRGSTYRTTART